MSRLPDTTNLQDSLIWDKSAFPDQGNRDEDILLVIREDVAIIVLQVLGFVFLAFLTLLIRTILSNLITSAIWLSFLDVAVNITNLLLLLLFTLRFHDYYLSLQIVTTDRVIDIDQNGIFKREVNELAITNIEDVTYKQTGFWATILGYGNVIIKTASSNSEGSVDAQINGFVFQNVPSPKDVAALITGIYHDDQNESQVRAAKLNAEEIKKAFNPNTAQDIDAQPPVQQL